MFQHSTYKLENVCNKNISIRFNLKSGKVPLQRVQWPQGNIMFAHPYTLSNEVF